LFACRDPKKVRQLTQASGEKIMRFVVIVSVIAAYLGASGAASSQDNALVARMAGEALAWQMNNGRTRQVFEALPKGGDIHTHLRGAVYAESWLDWAAEDGLCVDMSALAIKFSDGASCADNGWITAQAARANENSRRLLINGLSVRSYVPTNGWSGHDQFFATFARINVAPHRLGDQLAAVSQRAGKQNILYLELMETLVLPELFPLVAGLELTGDVASDYAALMASPFGAQIDPLVALIKKQISEALARKDQLLGCGSDEPAAGCGVAIRLQHQVVREFPPEMVFAQIALGWAVMEAEPLVVGLNLVAPEDGFIALRDYSYHMRMIDHLYTTQGPQNVSLHAGELVTGLVRPKQLRFHIREAIEIGHAKRIGHGIAIAHEDNHEQLLDHMAANGIAVEINLTSNATILGVEGRAHPILLYRDLDVPYTINTDDEGVSRIDLTHEYIRLAQTYDVQYFELRHVSRNALTYSFLDGVSIWDSPACEADVYSSGEPGSDCREFMQNSEKANLQWELEHRFRVFEAELKVPKRKTNLFQ
jgi:adenosine deaminase